MKKLTVLVFVLLLTMNLVPIEWTDEALKVALLPAEEQSEIPDEIDETGLLQHRRMNLN